MPWIALHVAGGDAWFTGLALVVLAVLLGAASARRGALVAVRLVALLGAILAVASATPAAIALAVAGAAALVLWLGLEGERLRAASTARRRGLRVLVVACALLLAGLEVPWRLAPSPPAQARRLLYVIGDSISAGMGSGERTWPRRLAEEHGRVVVDLSEAGATVALALRQAEGVTADDALVLVEIGGNDLLGGTPGAEFEAGLERLLARIEGPGRTIVLLELPLPPFTNGWGAAQRRLAARHGALLVPRRPFLQVIGAEGATLDGLHLSDAGHAALADLVARVVLPGVAPRPVGSGPPDAVVTLDAGGALLGAERVADAGLALRLAGTVGGRPGSHVLLRRGAGVGPERVQAARKAAHRACVERFEVEGQEAPAPDE